MNARDRLSQLKEEFRRRVQDLPSELAVSKYRQWVGLEPIPLVDYQVEYEADAKNILRRVFDSGRNLGPLLRKLEFRLTENSLVVSLKRLSEFSS